jgi:predicted ferric reductase
MRQKFALEGIHGMTNQQFWWHLARASGIVTWGLLTASALWGVLLSTRLLKPYDRPAWLLDLHKWLGTLTLLGTGLHMGAIVGDSYVHFGTADVFVPFASDWKTIGVAWGIIGFYMLVAVQVSSWLMKKIPKPLWRSIHYLSYGLFVTISLHSSIGQMRAFEPLPGWEMETHFIRLLEAAAQHGQMAWRHFVQGVIAFRLSLGSSQ